MNLQTGLVFGQGLFSKSYGNETGIRARITFTNAPGNGETRPISSALSPSPREEGLNARESGLACEYRAPRLQLVASEALPPSPTGENCSPSLKPAG